MSTRWVTARFVIFLSGLAPLAAVVSSCANVIGLDAVDQRPLHAVDCDGVIRRRADATPG